LQLRLGQRLQLLERHARNHLYHENLPRHAAHAFADGALRVQFKALGLDRLEERAKVAGARIGADHLAQAAAIDQPRQPVIAIAGVVGDDGQLPGALFV
jgi:hypothetical protein